MVTENMLTCNHNNKGVSINFCAYFETSERVPKALIHASEVLIHARIRLDSCQN